MSVTLTPQVLGVRETLAALKDLEPELRRETVRDIRSAAEPMRLAAQQLVPVEAPLSGMARGRLAWGPGARRKIRTTVGGRARRERDVWPLVNLIQGDAAGALFDIAGRGSAGSTPQGQALIRGLTQRHGAASRSMWRAAEGNIEPVQREVIAAIDRAAAKVNRKLEQRGG